MLDMHKLGFRFANEYITDFWLRSLLGVSPSIPPSIESGVAGRPVRSSISPSRRRRSRDRTFQLLLPFYLYGLRCCVRVLLEEGPVRVFLKSGP